MLSQFLPPCLHAQHEHEMKPKPISCCRFSRANHSPQHPRFMDVYAYIFQFAYIYKYTDVYIYIYPRALRATPPPCLTKSKTEKQTKTVLFLDAPGVPQTSHLGAPGLHFETLGAILATPAPKGRQSRPKGPQMKKETLQESSKGRLWDPGITLGPCGRLFQFFCVKVRGWTPDAFF